MATKKPVIHLEDDDFGTVLTCAVRYALGRRTYMPHLVIEFIKPLLPYLDNVTLWCFKRDLEACQDFGDPEIDQPEWANFWAAVVAEDKRRKAMK